MLLISCHLCTIVYQVTANSYLEYLEDGLKPMYEPDMIFSKHVQAWFESHGILVGSLPGWWLGEEDGRHDGPTVSVERWHEELTNKLHRRGYRAVR